MLIYDEIKTAFDFYNKKLFNNELPECVITLTKKANSKGYFIYNNFINNDKKKHEISLNSEYFFDKSVKKTLSTLVHEMCHLKMAHIGHKSTSGYHDKTWAKEMKKIGLIPSSTSLPGGKETGFIMSHYIQKNGIFERVTEELFNQGFNFDWKNSNNKYEIFEKNKITDETIKNITKNTKIIDLSDKEFIIITKNNCKKNGIRIKYSCLCSNIWGKPNLNINCNKCHKPFIPQNK